MLIGAREYATDLEDGSRPVCAVETEPV